MEVKVFRAAAKQHANWGRFATQVCFMDWSDGRDMSGYLDMSDGPKARDALRRLQLALEIRLQAPTIVTEDVSLSFARNFGLDV